MYENQDIKKFYAQYLPWNDAFAIHMVYGKRVAARIIYEGHEPGQITEPILALSRDEAQTLMDRLYDVGLRPSLAAGTAGQLEAVKYHLEDMRKLVFK